MAKTITTIKTIATLGKRELRYTEMDGVKKFDIRAWKGDKYDDGVRFTQEEISQLYFRMKSNLDTVLIGNKSLVFENDEYALSIVSNGRTYIRPFATKDEMDKLMQILEVAKNNLLEYDPTPKVEEPKKKRGRPKKEVATTINAPRPSIDELIQKYSKTEPKKETKEKKKVYKNAYEKFNDQFKTFRESQPENRRKGYELTHKVILNHIKDIIATSEEYNRNAMQDWKNTHNMMSYCQDKAFENAEAMMNITSREEANELLFQWVDEYVGLDDKPEPPKKAAPKKTTAKKG